jgi:hypothetical protein
MRNVGPSLVVMIAVEAEEEVAQPHPPLLVQDPPHLKHHVIYSSVIKLLMNVTALKKHL